MEGAKERRIVAMNSAFTAFTRSNAPGVYFNLGIVDPEFIYNYLTLEACLSSSFMKQLFIDFYRHKSFRYICSLLDLINTSGVYLR